MKPLGGNEIVAFIGLGQMGRPMAARLVAAGWQVRATDVIPAARAGFESDTGVPAATDAAAAVEGASLVVIMLPSSAVVDQAIRSSGLLERLSGGADGKPVLLVDMGSSEPMSTRALAEAAGQFGVGVVDAPVSGGVVGARAGALTIMVGGCDADVERIRPMLSELGRSVLHVGPVGAGHAVKALNNLLSATHLLASAEALRIGRAFGLDPAILLEAVNGSSGRSGSTELKLPRYVVPESYDSGFRLRLLLKDMRIATDLARLTSAPSRLGDAALDLWAQAAESLPEDADHTEIYRWVAGGESENQSDIRSEFV